LSFFKATQYRWIQTFIFNGKFNPMFIEGKLLELGITLPEPFKSPQGVQISFEWVRLFEGRAYVSGHGPQNIDGTAKGPFGKVGENVTSEQAAESARLATISILAGLRNALGDLDRITGWLKLDGMISAAPGFINTTNIMTSSSELLLELFGPEVGKHARTAIGIAQLPLDLPVVIAAEIAFK
jgi:enamine deaminase RidA (YjgF/YER057c/UK114 family)